MNKGAKVGEKRTLRGEKAKELLSLRNEYVPKGVFQVGPFFISRGKGAWVEDVDGNEYIDFTGGICVLNIGHCNDKVVSAIKEQADKYLHTCFHVLMYESYVRLAKKLCKITPGDFPKQAILVNSGAEAVENAVKIARRYTGRYNVLAFERAFHGRTLLTMGLTSQVRMYKYAFGPTDIGIIRVPYPYEYRCPYKLENSNVAAAYLERVEEVDKLYASLDSIAAVIIEPVLGEGGYVPAPPEFLQGLRKICNDHGIVFIDDEVQAGIGRTGKMWAIEHSEVIPDMVTSAKSLGGGLVLSATIGRKDIMDSVDIGGTGTTFGGNPLCCVAALKTLEVIEEDKLLDRATKLGRIVKDRLEGMKGKYNIIGDVRGLGSMIGMELVKDRKSKEPGAAETRAILKKCHERGLLIMACGPSHNVIRFMFPLVIKEEDLEKGLDILENAISEVNEGI